MRIDFEKKFLSLRDVYVFLHYCTKKIPRKVVVKKTPNKLAINVENKGPKTEPCGTFFNFCHLKWILLKKPYFDYKLTKISLILINNELYELLISRYHNTRLFHFRNNFRRCASRTPFTLECVIGSRIRAHRLNSHRKPGTPPSALILETALLSFSLCTVHSVLLVPNHRRQRNGLRT